MAPLTRRRSINNIPNEMNVEYYRQRASAGLIITEGSQISTRGVGYINTPGIYNEKQVTAWKKVTDAVHEAGGKIYIQLWHVGRSSHPSFHNGELPLSASAVNPEIKVKTYDGTVNSVSPKEMSEEEITMVINQFSNSSQLAIDAGFDGVEIHGANGYLLDQFICDGSNHRTDKYGGRIENRARFTLDVVEAVAKKIGNDKTAIRFSPSGIFNGMRDSDPKKIYSYLVNELNTFDLSYVHFIEPFQTDDNRYFYPNNYLKYGEVAPYFREIYRGNLMICTSMTKDKGEILLQDGVADLIAFGKPFISNPDLVERMKENSPLTSYDVTTFYDGSEKGYIDYPFL